MRPFDPRLLRYASVRPATAPPLLGTITALLVLAQALLISAALSPTSRERRRWGDVIPFIGHRCCLRPSHIVAAREATLRERHRQAVTELRGHIDAAITLGLRWRARTELRLRRCCRPAWRIGALLFRFLPAPANPS